MSGRSNRFPPAENSCPATPREPGAIVTISRTSYFDAVDVAGLSGSAELADAGDRLVRHLFDVGLQLHALRVVFEQCGNSDLDRRAARDAVTGMLDDLDLLIRDSNLAMRAADGGAERE